MTESADYRDWSSGKRLFRMKSEGLDLSEAALARLEEILKRHPDWQFEPSEKAEFSIWTGTSAGERGDANALTNLSPDKILIEARAKMRTDSFSYSGLWRNFTRENPAKAFEALRLRALEGDIVPDEWQQLFFKLREETSNRELDSIVLKFLGCFDLSHFRECLNSIVDWLKDKRESLETLPSGWPNILLLWDKLDAVAASTDISSDDDSLIDIGMAILNSESGALVELLLQKLVSLNSDGRAGIPKDIASRLEKAIKWNGLNGLIAQCALLQRLPWLEHVDKKWTWQFLVPLLSTDIHDWEKRWEARFYHTSTGSKKLFEATKEAFLCTFKEFEPNFATEGQALLLVRASYHAAKGDDPWSFTSAEAREAVVKGGPALMCQIISILRHRGDGASAEVHWRDTVRPILDFLWPLTAAVQTKGTSQGLIQIMLDAHTCFPDAVDALIQFIRPWNSEKPWDFDHIFDDDALKVLEAYPTHALQLLDAHIDQNAVPVRLNEILDRLARKDASVVDFEEFSTLRGLARRSAA